MVDSRLVGKNHGLHAGNFEPLPASHILAGHQVILAQHVGAGFGEAGAVTLIGAAGKLALLGPDHPGDFILGGLVAVGTVQGRGLLLRALVEKIAFFHEIVVGWLSLVVGWSNLVSPIQPAKHDYCMFDTAQAMAT
jgi:hypothetical protein